MTTLEEPDPTPSGPDKEDQAAHYSTERRHVEALLDISEETPTDPEPREHPCASGWEDAVRAWAAVTPLSCIFSSQKPHRKTKHKDVGSPSLPNAERSAGAESRAGSSNGVRKSAPLQQQTGCCNSLQAGASQWSMQTSPSTEEGGPPSQPLSSKHPVPEHGPARPHQHSSKLVPIKNFTFLPPIKPPQHHPRLCEHLCGSMKASDQGAVCENDAFLASGTRWGPECPVYPTALSSKCPTCQHSLSLFSTISLSDPKRPQGPVSSKRDTAHCSSFSMGRSVAPALRSPAAVGAHGPGCLFS